MNVPYISPYKGVRPTQWASRTKKLLGEFPLQGGQIVNPILEAWDGIFESKIGRHGIQVGKDIFPTPQIMASYLHELIPLEFAALYPGKWLETRMQAKRTWYTFQMASSRQK